MKKLGLVGGMGPESTIPYYHDIVYGVQEALGKSLFPELSIESVNVFEVLRLCGEKQYDELTDTATSLSVVVHSSDCTGNVSTVTGAVRT